MNDAPHSRDRLIAELFDEDWAGGQHASAALRAAAMARRKRTLRRAAAAGAVAAAIGALIVGRFAAGHIGGVEARSPTWPASANDAAHLGRQPGVLSPSSPSVSAPVPHPGYEILTDDELIAQVKDRPLLVLHGPNGSRKIIVLNE